MSASSKRKLTDYAGLAALLTAAGAVAFGVIDRADRTDEGAHHKRMSRSIFNAGRERIAVLEYRVAELEGLCEGLEAAAPAALVSSPKPPRAHRPGARRPASVMAAGESSPFAIDLGTPDEDELADEEIPPEPVSFDQIQQIVDDGETYEAPP